MKKHPIITIISICIICIFIIFRLTQNVGKDFHYNLDLTKSVNNFSSESEEIIKEDYISIQTELPMEKAEAYVFIGDSRFVGMNSACNIDNNDNYFVIAKTSQGYSWLANTALEEFEKLKKDNLDIEKWNVILGLGINDLYNISKYISIYEELKNDNNLYLLSVNPIEFHNSITNKKIEEFNKKLKDIDNIFFIDSYSCLIEDGFETKDGVHYNNETYEKIFSFIKKNIKTEK